MSGTEDGLIVLKLLESSLKMAIRSIREGWMVSSLQEPLADRIRSRKTKHFLHLKGKHVIASLVVIILKLRLIFTIPQRENLLLRQCNH